MWLVVGADSIIGSRVVQTAERRGHSVIGTTRRAPLGAGRYYLDMAAESFDTYSFPSGVEAACICAAVARLNQCAEDPAGSEFINITQSVSLIKSLITAGVYVIFLSSNQVFDGLKPNVLVNERRHPVSEYGRQKAVTETVIEDLMRAGAPISILRLSKVVLPEAGIFSDWIGNLENSRAITAFGDMSLAPIPVTTVADVILHMMQRRLKGVFQLSGPDDTTYLNMAKRLCQELGRPQSLIRVTSASLAGMPPGAAPPYTTMDPAPLSEHLHLDRPDPWTILQDCILVHGRKQKA